MAEAVPNNLVGLRTALLGLHKAMESVVSNLEQKYGTRLTYKDLGFEKIVGDDGKNYFLKKDEGRRLTRREMEDEEERCGDPVYRNYDLPQHLVENISNGIVEFTKPDAEKKFGSVEAATQGLMDYLNMYSSDYLKQRKSHVANPEVFDLIEQRMLEMRNLCEAFLKKQQATGKGGGFGSPGS